MSDQQLKIAVFIDFDNIEIGVKTTLNATFDVGAVLDAIKERGEVITKVAYGDWTRAGEYSRHLTQQAIRMVQRNMTPGGDKNGADINLALDALESALTHKHINAYVIVGGDSDFISLVEKLKQYDKTVFVVGGRAFTSVILQKNCHEFLAYENLIGAHAGGRRAPEKGRPPSQSPLKQVLPLVRRALQVLADREVSPQLGLLKSTLLQLDSTFSERDYGAGSFRDFAERLAHAGLVRLNQTGRSVLVELRDGELEPAVEVEPPAAVPPPAPMPAEPVEAAAEPESGLSGQPLEAIRAVRAMFERMQATVRWPMYVRNVKQHIRSIDQTFDERKYGFAGILDLLRGCQREGVLRLERDRKGVLRVFPGHLIQRPTTTGTPVDAVAAEPQTEAVADAVLAEPVSPFEVTGTPVPEAGSPGQEGVTDEVGPASDPQPVEVIATPSEDKAARRRRPAATRRTAARARPVTRQTRTKKRPS